MKSCKPLISIVIPTYNHASFLGKCLDSVLKQTYQKWEAIIINNYSQDNTVEVIKSRCDSRIRVINFENNGIIAASRNEGMRRSHGEFIAFLDSDDLWFPEKLKKCLARLKAGADLVSHGMRYIKGVKRWKDVMCGPAKMADYSKLFYNGNCIIVSATMVRKSCLEHVSGFDENPAMVSAEDYDLWLRLAKEKTRLSFIPEILGEYNCHDNSISKQTIKHLRASLIVVNKHFSHKKKYTLVDFLKLRRVKALFLYGAARSFQHNGEMRSSLKFFLKAIMQFPFLLRIYAGILFTFLPQSVVNRIIYFKYKNI